VWCVFVCVCGVCVCVCVCVCDSALSLHFPVQYENNDRFYEELLALSNQKNQQIFEAILCGCLVSVSDQCKRDYEGQFFLAWIWGVPPPPLSIIPPIPQLNHSHIVDSQWYQQLTASLKTRLKRESTNGFLYCLVIIPGDRNVDFNLVALLFPPLLFLRKADTLPTSGF